MTMKYNEEISELKEILFNIKELWDNGWYTSEDENYVMLVEEIERINELKHKYKESIQCI